MRGFIDQLESELADLERADRQRACAPLAGSSRVRPSLADRTLVSFCSNDYLGLASHPALIAAAAAAAARDGFGASAARLVSGDLPAHRALEAQLAAFLRLAAALVFPTGYQANVGVLTSLAGPHDLIVSDALNHASIIDGCRLSRARVEIYPHRDAAAARRLLQHSVGFRRRIVVTESLFSMDGDAAPLDALAAAAAEFDAIFVVDEAHALGVLGPEGRGFCALCHVVPDVFVGTLGKAFGAAGGFVAGHGTLRRFLVNRARTFIYTTALPPPVAAAAAAAIEICQSPDGDRRRGRLAANRDRLIAGLAAARLLPSPPAGPIIPVILGSDTRALAVSRTLAARGIFATAIRPPTVPAGTARLRLTLSADHSTDDVDALLAALLEVAR